MRNHEEDRTRWIRSALAEHEGPLLRYARRSFSGDLERARDVVQDTFIRLCRADRAKIEDHLPQWLFTVCRNRALEVLRKEGRMKPLDEKQLATQHGDGPDPAAAAERRDTAAGILRVLATLPEKQQEVVRLKFQNDMTYEQIGEVVGTSISNVGYLLHTALRTVRRQMQRQEG